MRPLMVIIVPKVISTLLNPSQVRPFFKTMGFADGRDQGSRACAETCGLLMAAGECGTDANFQAIGGEDYRLP